MELKTITATGKSGTAKVHDDIFKAKVLPAVIYKSYVLGETNKRYAHSATLEKGNVRGGGRKPYRQKGTGHARQGSTRNPHYKGGGVAFGPSADRAYNKKMPLKEKRLALFGALSLAAEKGQVMVADVDATKKTLKDYSAFLKALPEARSYIVYQAEGAAMQKALNNVKNVSIKSVKGISVKDLLAHDVILFTKEGLDAFQAQYVS